MGFQCNNCTKAESFTGWDLGSAWKAGTVYCVQLERVLK